MFTINFTVESDDETSLMIDSVSYEAGNKVALLYISEKGKLDTVTLTVSAQDQEDYDDGGSTIIQKTMDVYIRGYNNPGVHYAATQTAHWQAMPYGGSISPKPGQEYILSETRANDLCKEDFFWGKMWGYIMPPANGFYNFDVSDGEGAVFYLSTDGTPENLPEQSPK